MSVKERDRLDLMNRVKRGELSVTEASTLLHLSLRQTRRLWKRFQAVGASGLLHGLRGRSSNHRLDVELRGRVLQRHAAHYRDFGPTLACEKLAADGLRISVDTLTRWLKQEGLWERRRRRGKHRQRRMRRSCLGALVQIDGSLHDWFEGRGPACVLMDLVDDATGLGLARFYAAETTEAAFDVLSRWFGQYGLPRALYADRHGIYRDEDHPECPTQVGRALADLGVELILARSPQAKGRVERRHGLMQDRLVKEMRLRNIRTIAEANAFLDGMFLQEMNRRYTVKARREEDLHRRLSESFDLGAVMAVHEERAVGRDWCVTWRRRVLQIDARHEMLSLAGKRVTVIQRGDGRVSLMHQGRELMWQELAGPPPLKARSKPVVVKRKHWKPASTHPWQAPVALPRSV